MSDSDRYREGARVPRGANGRSGIIEHMRERAGLEGNPYNRPFAVVLDVSHVKDSAGAFRISDRHGFVPTSEEFWTFVDHVARFYQMASDAEIEAYNRQQYFNHQHETNAAASLESRGLSEGEGSKKAPQAGYVYVLRGGGFYKIGRAKDPHKRAETLAIQLPYESDLVGYVHAPDYRALEAELHERFAHKRKNGEWFDLGPEDLAYILGMEA